MRTINSQYLELTTIGGEWCQITNFGTYFFGGEVAWFVIFSRKGVCNIPVFNDNNIIMCLLKSGRERIFMNL